MPGKTRFQKLLEPGQIGRVKTRNRIYKTAALMEYTTEQNKAFVDALARGGVGIISLGSFDVNPFPTPYMVHVGDDNCIPGLAEVARSSHKYGCPTFLAMLHGGPRYHSWTYDLQAVAASAAGPSESGLVSEDAKPYPRPRALTIDEIQETVDKFARAAERGQKAGFDGVEINGATDHLINSFLSRAWNKRQDAYGCGNMEDRTRFLVEIIQAIKKRLGRDYPVTVLMNGAEYGIENGTTPEESQVIARILEKAGADALHIRAYGYRDYFCLIMAEQAFYPEPPRPLGKGLDGSHHGAGCLVPLAAAIKKVVSIPVITVGRLSPQMGERILQSGKADFIGMTRRLIADPEFPSKIAWGRMEDIAPCTACINCVSTVIMHQGGARCRINATLGSEQEYTVKPAERKKKVMVIGGGPAGMEAARVAGLRGHEVTLFEKEPKLGGLLPLATMVKGVEIEDIPALVRYLKTQITKLGVKINLGQEADLSVIEKAKPDAVIIATGGIPAIPEIPGINRRNVVSNADLHRRANRYLRFFGPRVLRWLTKFWMPVGKKVVIVGGAIEGCEVAEFLVKRGRQVTIIETAEELGAGLTIQHKYSLIRWLDKKGVVVMTGVKYEEITDRGPTIITKEGKRQTLEADTVLLAMPLIPDTRFFNALEGKVPEIYAIGDCKEPDIIRTAIADGWRVGSMI